MFLAQCSSCRSTSGLYGPVNREFPTDIGEITGPDGTWSAQETISDGKWSGKGSGDSRKTTGSANTATDALNLHVICLILFPQADLVVLALFVQVGLTRGILHCRALFAQAVLATSAITDQALARFAPAALATPAITDLALFGQAAQATLVTTVLPLFVPADRAE
jgi:hypothetical protein